MPRKPWHIFMTRGPRGFYVTGVSNDPEKIVGALYVETARDRTHALKREAEIKKMSRTQKQALVKTQNGFSDELPGKLYQVRNEGFVCANCGAEVEPTKHDTPRNHCPFCLHSLHVDVNPGDRANECRGLLQPMSVETSGRKGYVIIYRCEHCGKNTRGKAALKTTVQPDDFDMLIELSRKALKKSKLLF